MNKTLIYLFTIFNFFCANGQEKKIKTGQKEFDKAMDFYHAKSFDSAIVNFEKMINSFPNSELIGRAKYNIGYIYLETDRNEEAISVFKEIIDSNFNENDTYGGVMEQYTLYKHRSCLHLVEINLEKKEYKSALDYNRKAEKKYPYSHFHNSEIIDNEIFIASNYSKIYRGLGAYKKALKYILPYTFYDRNYIIKDITENLDKLYSKEQIVSELNKSKKKIIYKNKNFAVVNLFGKKLKIYEDLLYTDMNANDIKKYFELKGLDVYKQILENHPLYMHYLNN
jgi:tetratricopeptide (TPR) repeat protein